MKNIQYFQYGETEVAYLKSKDPVLGAAMDELGHLDRAVTPDLFIALTESIIGQQISSKAQETVCGRVRERFSPLSPHRIAAASAEEIQTCGITMKKAIYIKNIADMILDGSLDLEKLHSMSDEEVCKQLCQIKGIGIWTAEMLMIFSMQRENILSWDDLAIQRGLRMLYHHRKITRKLFAKYKRRYAPYATVASLYLWAIAGGACKDLKDHAPK